MDETPVDRRQFFRGLAGDLLKVAGEMMGMDAEPAPPVKSWVEGDEIVSPEKQQAALNDLFGFLEQLGAREEAAAADGEAGEPSEPAPPPSYEPETLRAAREAPEVEPA
jgi:hypothetical protein